MTSASVVDEHPEAARRQRPHRLRGRLNRLTLKGGEQRRKKTKARRLTAVTLYLSFTAELSNKWGEAQSTSPESGFRISR
jgi:hypothetical protein